MKNKFYVLLFILPLWGLGGCNDDDSTSPDPIDQLPPATQTGENTFGCLVNGEPFVVTNFNDLVAFYQVGVLFLGGEKDVDNVLSHVNITINESISGGSLYVINNDTPPKGEYYTENCFHYTNTEHIGSLTITHFDSINYVISGRFEFEAFSSDCQTAITITNGRFDMQYIP